MIKTLLIICLILKLSNGHLQESFGVEIEDNRQCWDVNAPEKTDGILVPDAEDATDFQKLFEIYLTADTSKTGLKDLELKSGAVTFSGMKSKLEDNDANLKKANYVKMFSKIKNWFTEEVTNKIKATTYLDDGAVKKSAKKFGGVDYYGLKEYVVEDKTFTLGHVKGLLVTAPIHQITISLDIRKIWWFLKEIPQYIVSEKAKKVVEYLDTNKDALEEANELFKGVEFKGLASLIGIKIAFMLDQHLGDKDAIKYCNDLKQDDFGVKTVQEMAKDIVDNTKIKPKETKKDAAWIYSRALPRDVFTHVKTAIGKETDAMKAQLVILVKAAIQHVYTGDVGAWDTLENKKKSILQEWKNQYAVDMADHVTKYIAGDDAKKIKVTFGDEEFEMIWSDGVINTRSDWFFQKPSEWENNNNEYEIFELRGFHHQNSNIGLALGGLQGEGEARVAKVAESYATFIDTLTKFHIKMRDEKDIKVIPKVDFLIEKASPLKRLNAKVKRKRELVLQ